MNAEDLIIYLLKILILFAIVLTLLLTGFIISGGQGGDNFATFMAGVGVYLSFPALFAGILALFLRKKKDQHDDAQK